MAKEKFDFVQPFKDIPAFFKGFPKNIVHFWKDPVTSSTEVATRKREILPFLYLSVCLFAIMIIPIIFLPDISFILAIPALCIAYCAFLLFVAKKAAQKFADIECSNCKERIAFDNNVKIKVIDRKFSIKKDSKTIEKNGVPYQATISVKGEETITAEISCKCQKCGSEKTFTHKFVSLRCNKTGVKVPYVQSGALLIQYESDVNNAYPSAFENLGEIRPVSGELVVGGKSSSSQSVGNDVSVTFYRSPEALVKGYFGNDL